MRSAQAGFQLVDLLVATSVAAISLTLAVPPLLRLVKGTAVELAAEEIVGALREARAYAIRQSANVGLKFRVQPDGRAAWALYLDGDGDGVRTADIDAGVDPLAGALRNLEQFGASARLGFPPGRAPSDPSNPRKRLAGLDDPIRFNASDLASFSPLGAATPGSIYVTDGVRRLLCVRIDSRTSRARILRWQADGDRWE
jgi:type II secretory pathway pseudopilin PulG